MINKRIEKVKLKFVLCYVLNNDRAIKKLNACLKVI